MSCGGDLLLDREQRLERCTACGSGHFRSAEANARDSGAPRPRASRRFSR